MTTTEDKAHLSFPDSNNRCFDSAGLFMEAGLSQSCVLASILVVDHVKKKPNPAVSKWVYPFTHFLGYGSMLYKQVEKHCFDEVVGEGLKRGWTGRFSDGLE